MGLSSIFILPLAGRHALAVSRDGLQIVVAGPEDSVLVLCASTGRVMHWFGNNGCGQLQFKTIFRICFTNQSTIIMAEVRKPRSFPACLKCVKAITSGLTNERSLWAHSSMRCVRVLYD